MMDKCTQELKLHVPSTYLRVVSCYCKLYSVMHGGSSDIIVVGTVNGEIIEFSQKKVLKTCDVHKNHEAESIKLFSSYSPYVIYYIVQFASVVYAIVREETLKVFRTFRNVKEIEINDFKEVGCPQLGLWFDNQPLSKYPHCVTDFSTETNKLTTPNISDEFSLLYHKFLQENWMKCKKLEKELEAKQQFRFKCCQQFLVNELKDGLSEVNSTSELHCVVGEATRAAPKEPHPVFHSLEVRGLWQRVHNGTWLIGIQVVNKGSSEAINLKVLLKASSADVSYETRFLVKKSPHLKEGSCFSCLKDNWCTVSSLNPDQLCTATASLKLSSCLLGNDLSLQGVILYNTKKNPSKVVQLPLPEVRLSPEEVSAGTLAPFLQSPSVSQEDLLWVLVSCLSLQMKLSVSVTTLLTKGLCFHSLLDHSLYLCSNRASPLFGVLAETWLQDGVHYLNVYYKNSTQIALLMRCLKSHLPCGVEIKDPEIERSADIDKMYSTLEAEIKHTFSWFAKMQTKSSSQDEKITVSRKDYNQFRTSLFELELQTDEAAGCETTANNENGVATSRGRIKANFATFERVAIA